MNYLIFDEQGDLIDFLTFNSDKELNSFANLHPEYTIQSEDLIDDMLFEDDDDLEYTNDEC